MLNKKGQALTELALIAPVLILLVISVVWFARVILTWQQLVSAARYGTDMIADTRLSEREIKKDILNYLTHHWIEGRRLDKNKIKQINIDIKDYPQITFNAFELAKAAIDVDDIVKGIVAPASQASSVSINYEYDIPGFLASFAYDKKINLKVKSSVLSGTGCSNKIHNRRD